MYFWNQRLIKILDRFVPIAELQGASRKMCLAGIKIFRTQIIWNQTPMKFSIMIDKYR